MSPGLPDRLFWFSGLFDRFMGRKALPHSSLLAVTVRTDTDRRSSVGVGRGVGGCVRPPLERRCACCRKPWEVCNCGL